MTISRELLDKGRIDFSDVATGKRLRSVHPGKILLHDFLEPLNMSAYALAKAVGVTPIRVTQILRGERGVSADTALLLGRFFGTSAELWLGLQAQYDLEIAGHASITKKRLAKIAPYKENATAA
jgi:addiction module HigA family antidote